MNRQERIQLATNRLKKTIEKLESLQPGAFNYSRWVTKFDEVNNCGTVCCVAGYYPMWFPESDLVYLKDGLNRGVKIVSKEFKKTGKGYKNVTEMLREFHHLDEESIDFLFYGEPLDYWPVIDSSEMHTYSVLSVIERFKYVIREIERFVV